MSRHKKSKTTDSHNYTVKAIAIERNPCSDCGTYWVEAVHTADYSKIGNRCLGCGKTVLWDVPKKRDTSKN
ncbi:MAG: hypothetical protein KME46_33355 [Brasilonema angustatum HA4187-MV1]|jgi:hypothetical protein|nr:hypothetical protein [Brasilonema angustatum HA4187-MV1]